MCVYLCDSDIRALNNQAVRAVNTGMIILGGGLIKHHICNANLMVGVRQCVREREREREFVILSILYACAIYGTKQSLIVFDQN